MTIKLELPEELTALTGFYFGNKVYRTQLMNRYDIDKITIVELPYNICQITDSFIEGFYDAIVKKYGIYWAYTKVQLHSTDNLINGKIIRAVTNKLNSKECLEERIGYEN